MNADFRNRQLPYNNPIANALVVVFGVVAIAVSFVIGVVAFVALAAAVLVLAAVIGIRIWWLGLQARKQGGQQPRANSAKSTRARGATVIEGEYHIVPAKKESDEPPQT